MIVRRLVWGGVMLALGALFTLGLATAMQMHATVAPKAFVPGSAPSVAAEKRGEREWMF
jgi:hypothetical protein